MRQIQPTVLISGFTAAGKTTHARLLAAHLGFEYLGASQLRRALLRSPADDLGREWDPAVDLRRQKTPACDRMLDDLISRKIQASARPLVVDAWLQPWLSTDDAAIRVWIESSSESRTHKATVTFLRTQAEVPPDVGTQIADKDEFSCRMFSKLYGIEFGPNPRVFDLIIDNSGYMDRPSIEASNVGIAQFEPMLEQAIEEECTRRRISLPTASCVRRNQELPISAGMTVRFG